MKNNYLYRKIFGLLIVALFAVSCSSDGLAVGGDVGGEEGDILPLRRGCLSSKALYSQIEKGVVPADLDGYDQDSREVFSHYPAGATVVARYVTTNGMGNGTTYATAASNVKTVLDGITDASAGRIYTILIEPGIYDAGAKMSMKNHVAIIGKCSGTSEEVIVLSGGENHQVFNNTSIDRTATLHGVVIAGGRAVLGGGMHNTNSSPLVNRVTFISNTAYSMGGGLYNGSASYLLLTEVTFSTNFSHDLGGGMYNDNSSPVLTRVTFSGNKAGNKFGYTPGAGNGGGLYNNSGTVNITDAFFSQNEANSGSKFGFIPGVGNGGGLYNNGGTVNITDAFFSQNEANSGSGLYNGWNIQTESHSELNMNRVIFSKNKAKWGGGMLFDSSSATLVNTAFFSNRAESGYGGGIWAQQSTLMLTSSTFLGNRSRCGGGGILSKRSKVEVNNTIMWENKNESTASKEGGDEILVITDTFDTTIKSEECEEIPNAFISRGAKEISDNGFLMSASIIRDVTNSVDPRFHPFNYYNRGEIVEGVTPTASSAVNQGLYVRRIMNNTGTQAVSYYSVDNANWYIDPGLSIAYPKLGISGTPSPADAIDLTATDATGRARTGRPDLGAYEAR